MPNDLNIRIKINSDTKALEVTQTEFDKLGKSTESASREVEKSSDRVANSIDNISSKATKAAGVIAGVFVFDKLKDGAKEFLSTAGQFEQYAVSLEVLSGSASKAQQGFDWIKDFTAKTPYELNETTEAFIRLKAYGIDATDGSLRILGDTSAALSKPLMSAVEAMADAITGENERLKEFGITASVSGKKIAYNWIDSSGQAKIKVIDNNKQIIKSTLEAIFNEKYAGMMDKQSQTLNGMVSNFEDTWTNLENTITNNSGAFDVAKSSISGATTALQTMGDHLDDIVLYGKYTLEAASAIAIYKGAVIGVNTVQNLHAKYMAASTIATTTYNIATNTTTASVERLTFAQLALNTAMKANPWMIAGTAAIGLGVVLTHEMDKFNAASKNALDGVKNLQTAESVQKEIDRTVNALSESKKKIADWGGLDSIFGNRAIEEKNAARLENRLKFLGSKLSELGQTADTTSSKVSNVSSPLTDAEIEKQKKAAESLKQSYLSINKDIANLVGTDHDKAIASINEQAEKYRNAKVDELTVASYISSAKLALIQKETEEQNKLLIDHYKSAGEDDAAYYLQLSSDIDEMVKKGIYSYDYINQYRIDKDNEYLTKKAQIEFEADQASLNAQVKYIDDQRSASIEYYKAIGSDADVFVLEEADRMQKLAETGAYTNAQMLAIWTKDNEKFQKEQREKDNKFWYDLLSDFEKAMGEQIFDAMTDKWQSFGDWLKDFWSSITTSIARAASSQLSKGIIDEVKNMAGLGSSGSASSNIVGTLKTLLAGGAFAGSAMYGATTDSAGFTTTAGGTVIDAGGQITKAGTDNLGQVGDIVNGISTIKTAYEAMTGELSASIYSAINSASMNLYGSGMMSLNSATALNNFGYGVANPWAMSGANGATGYGAMAGEAALGAAGGYVLGKLGDLLFGANTKAGSYGAIGGSIGAMTGNPVIALAGAALGSIIGGLFGSTKEVDRGLYFKNDTTSNNGLNSIQSYRDTETKSWFSGSGNSDYNDITDSQKKSIEGIFKSYDYLLNQLGSTKNIVLKASRYTAETFQDEIAKGFLATYMGIEQHASEYLYSRNGVVFTKYNDTEEMTKIYNMWSEYAKSVDKTVMQALTDSVNTYIQSNRDFTIWELERSGNTTEALRQKAQWLQDDFANLENMMGVTGITVENFTSMYSDAVKDSLDPTTITQWQSLGSALQSATDAQDSYAKALQDTAVSGFNQLSSAYSTFSNGIDEARSYLDQLNGSVLTFDQAGDDPAKIMQAYQAQTDQITQISNNRISALQKELDYSKTLLKVASDLRYSAMSGTSQFTYADTMLNQYISDATTKLASGKDISSEVQNISSLAGNYAQLAQNYYSDQVSFDYAVSSMANKIEALGGKGSTSTLSDIETAINMENDSLSTALKALKDEASGRLQSVIDAYSTGQQLIADQMQSQLDSYVEFWGVDSPIVAKLQEILQSLGLQYSLNTSGAGSSSASAITSAYQNILGRTPDTAGADYWTSKINSGDLNTGEAGIAIGAAAATNGEISVSQYITDLYTQGLGRTPDDSGLAYWNNVVSSGQLSIDQLASTFSSAAGSNGESFHKFADGGLVKGGKGGIIGQIGEEDYDELILPLKDPNDPLGLKALRSDSLMMRQSDPMIALLGTIVTLLEKLGYDMNSVLSQISDNTKQSRRA